jgi:CheY-like chemotaxis protein
MSERAILCVDDEAIILLALKNELRRAFGGRFVYETALRADSGLEALDRLSSQGVEVVLVISDWLMPGVKGDEFLSIVRGRFPDTKAIMITGQADEDVIRESVASGLCVAVLRKPWKAAELVRAVEGIVDLGECGG